MLSAAIMRKYNDLNDKLITNFFINRRHSFILRTCLSIRDTIEKLHQSSDILIRLFKKTL
jgi:hypothetical protein